jgi:hypothetical protein
MISAGGVLCNMGKCFFFNLFVTYELKTDVSAVKKCDSDKNGRSRMSEVKCRRCRNVNSEDDYVRAVYIQVIFPFNTMALR